MNLNTKGPFFLTQALLPLLKKAATMVEPARIVMISSVAAVSSESLSSYSYGPSKAAIAQLGKMLARDLAKDHILVNTIGPAMFESKMTSHFDADMMAKAHPVGRIGRPTDIAGLTIFLTSKAGSFVTGTYIPFLSENFSKQKSIHILMHGRKQVRSHMTSIRRWVRWDSSVWRSKKSMEACMQITCSVPFLMRN